MRILMKPIQVYALWDEEGMITPLAFSFTENDAKIKIPVKVDGREEQRITGHIMLQFFCRGKIGETEKNICLRYDVKNHRWYLYKMQ